MTTDSALRRQLFVTLGLSDKEALLYDTLLTHGPQGSGVLEKLSHLKKNTYSLLRSLERRQLVSMSYVEGKKVFVPAPPDQLLISIKEQKRALANTQALLEAALPELSHAYQTQVGSPIVRHFTGLPGLRAVFDEVYKNDKSELIGCVGNEVPDERFHQEIMSHYKPMRIANNIFARSISPDSARARELKANEAADLKEKILVDPHKYPMPSELDVWNDKIALMTFARHDFAGIIIQHSHLATTIHSLVQLAIDMTNELNRLKQDQASQASPHLPSQKSKLAVPYHPPRSTRHSKKASVKH